jgi:hypothetical protein
MTTWMHSRKGRIVGEVVRQDHTWMWVRLSGDHTLRYGSECNRGRVDEEGEILCLRRSMMTELSLTQERPHVDLIADALLGAEEILEVLHNRGTRGVEQECDAVRIADVLNTVRAAKLRLT